MPTWAWIILIVIAVIVLFIASTYNQLVVLRNKVRDQWAQIEVQLKKRFDLIPNLVETVKGYAKHEKETLKTVVELRNNTYDDLSDENKMNVNEKVSSGINKLMALKESYPELKANDQFKELSTALTKIEDEIANARKYYNAVVRLYNNKVEMFPNNIVAKMFGFISKKMFEANASERENVKVEI